MTLIFDLETNGLRHDATRIHCLCIHDTEANKTYRYNDEGNTEPIVRGITYLNEAPRIVGHNVINFDIPMIQKFYPWFEPEGQVLDTLVLSRLYHPDLLILDKRRRWKDMPLKLYGRHSLQSYGHRLGCLKGEYGETNDWTSWSTEMEDYCEQDVNVTTKLWDHFQPYLNGSR